MNTSSRKVCAYCKAPIRDWDDTAHCSRCGAVYHDDCRRRVSRCVRPGCFGGNVVSDRPVSYTSTVSSTNSSSSYSEGGTSVKGIGWIIAIVVALILMAMGGSSDNNYSSIQTPQERYDSKYGAGSYESDIKWYNDMKDSYNSMIGK